jgi:citrate lyase subunit beta/citryl-CoA lyase
MTGPLTWRSALYVPASNARFVEKAQTRGADAVILDLEDGVAPAQKAEARTRAAATIAPGSPAAWAVRINSPMRLAAADIEAVIRPGLAALLVPKCESADRVCWLAEAVTELEAERRMTSGSVALVPIIETPQALARATEIAAAHPRCAALMLGGEDFAAAIGATTDPEVLQLPRQMIVFAARAAGVTPLGLMQSIADFADTDALAAAARRARRFGFEGATCVHPGAVAVLNAAFTPDADEVAQAQRILDAMQAGLTRGEGAVRLDGQMIDAPVAARAARVLAAAQRREMP